MSFSPGKKKPSLAQRRLPAPSAFSARGIDETKTSAVKTSDLLTPASQKHRINRKIMESNSKFITKQQRPKELAAKSCHTTRTKATSCGSLSPRKKIQPNTSSPETTCTTTSSKRLLTTRDAKSRELAVKLAYLRKLEEKEKEDAEMLLLARALLKTRKGQLSKEKRCALDMLNKLEPILQQILPPESTSPQQDIISSNITFEPTEPAMHELIQQRRPFIVYDSEDEYYDDGSFWGTGRSSLDVKQREPFIGGDCLSQCSHSSGSVEANDDNEDEERIYGDNNASVDIESGNGSFGTDEKVSDIQYDILPPESSVSTLSSAVPAGMVQERVRGSGPSGANSWSSTCTGASVSAACESAAGAISAACIDGPTSNCCEITYLPIGNYTAGGADNSHINSSACNECSSDKTSCGEPHMPMLKPQTSLSRLWGFQNDEGNESDASDEVGDDEWDN